jgi:hypothetical protein
MVSSVFASEPVEVPAAKIVPEEETTIGIIPTRKRKGLPISVACPVSGLTVANCSRTVFEEPGGYELATV